MPRGRRLWKLFHWVVDCLIVRSVFCGCCSVFLLIACWRAAMCWYVLGFVMGLRWYFGECNPRPAKCLKCLISKFGTGLQVWGRGRERGGVYETLRMHDARCGACQEA